MYKVYRDPEGKSEVSSATNHSFHYNEKMYKEQIQKLNREVVDLKMVGPINHYKCICNYLVYSYSS